jgi:hypothetical protein
MFEVGDRVVCSDCTKPLCQYGNGVKLYLMENKIYTIKDYQSNHIMDYIILEINGENIYLNPDRFKLYNFRKEKILKLKQNIKNYESKTSNV